jgi:hypothetical protein
MARTNDDARAGLRRDRIGAAAVAAVLGLLYALTLCPTVGWYDSAEFSAIAATLRVVPHPPGYPLYAFLAHAFTWLPGEAALGVNVMSAVFGVVGAILLYGLALRVQVDRLSAAMAALAFGLVPAWWGNAVVAEVYTPGIAWGLAVLLLCHRTMTQRRAWLGWVAAALGGAGLGVHMSMATMGLGFVVLLGAACVRLRDGRRGIDLGFALRLLPGCAIGVVLGACVLLLVPLGPFEEMTPLGPHHTTREQMWTLYSFQVRGGIFRLYFKDFELQPRLLEIAGIVRAELGLPGVLAGVAGLVAGARRQPVFVAALVLVVAGNVGWFFDYDVPDLEGFLLPSIAALALGIALLGDTLRRRVHRFAPWAFVALPIAFAWQGYAKVDRSRDRSAREYGEAACASLPDAAILAMTSRPDEWRRYTVLLYMHETGAGCRTIEFWGSAQRPAIAAALARGREVFAFVEKPRFADTFEIVPEGAVYRVR